MYIKFIRDRLGNCKAMNAICFMYQEINVIALLMNNSENYSDKPI